jgi:hypothetical protein
MRQPRRRRYLRTRSSGAAAAPLFSVFSLLDVPTADRMLFIIVPMMSRAKPQPSQRFVGSVFAASTSFGADIVRVANHPQQESATLPG